ncbi:Fructose-2,6-bisphosphatase TIGAR B [Folsomia candida]|uniref:Fructose-2,6-bisphosphatase TIGAR n=1 Tax=Folsomia candida TaxID=158441 RepID=A0A226F653_FOLCA|nr:Fructose-2,6-bisphosphatase TIGAR B [Folsomia candida]
MGVKTATVYVVRHGETVGNDTKLIMHPDEDVLNTTGKIQATNLAQTLKEVNFTDVYTSNYPRTIETASIVLSHNLNNKSPPTKTDERLREIVMHIMITSNFRNICVTIFCVFHKGIDNMYGQPYGTIFKALIAFLNSGRPLDEFAVQESEPLPEIRKRAGEFLVDLIQNISKSNSPDQTILIVSHGAFIRFFLEHFTNAAKFNLAGWDPSALKFTRNTGCNMFVIHVPDESETEQQIRVNFEKIHDFSHLTKEMLETDSLTRIAQTPEGKCISGCMQV